MNSPATPTPRLSGKPARDPRIDFFRGIALLFIFTNHFADLTQSPLLKLVSWRTWGMSDAAELFIFISGVVYGLVYDRTRARGGATALIAKSWKRLAQLYGANALTLLICIFGLAAIAPGAGWLAPWSNEIAANPVRLTAGFLTFRAVPPFFDVLPLYMQLLFVMPFFLLLARRRLSWAVAISGVTYVLSFAFRPAEWTGTPLGLTFNPFAWQFLFLIGVVLGLRRNDAAGPLRLPRGLIAWSAGVLLISFACKVGIHAINYDLAGLGRHAAIATTLESWFDKGRLMPWRLLHFLALAHLVGTILPGMSSALWRHRSVIIVRRIGECSLQIFCFSLVLAYASWLVVANTQNTPVMQLALNGIAWGLMAAWSLAVTRRRAQRRAASEARETTHATAADEASLPRARKRNAAPL